MINKVIDYINTQLSSINKNYGLCERVSYVENDEEKTHIHKLGENGRIIDFDKVQSLSYIIPDGSVESEELASDVGCEILQRFNYPVELVIFKERCESPDLDEIYNIVQDVATNNAESLVSGSKAYSGAKIIFNSANHNKQEIWERDFTGNEFRIKLGQLLISLNFTIQLDLDLECDNITAC